MSGAEIERLRRRERELEAEVARLRDDRSSSPAGHYAAIFGSAVDFAIITTDRNGRVTAWNPGAERILGWSAGEMVGQPTSTFFTPEDRVAGWPETEMRCAAETGRANDERWHLRKDGTRFWASGELMPLRSPEGASLGFLKILRDRTEATASEGETRRVRDELQVVTDALPVLISFIDRDYVYRFVNRYYETWFGRPASEILDRRVREVVGEAVYQARLPLMARALAGEDIAFDGLMPYRDGASRQSEIRYIPRRAVDGTVDGIFVMVTDIAERQAAQADLQEAEDRLRLALEGAGTGIYDYDLVTGMLTWDARTRALFGLSDDDPVSYEGAFLPGVHPDDRERADRAVQAAIGSRDGFDIEYRVVGRHDGVERVLAARGNTVFRDGRPVRFVGTVRDITEARAAEASARRLAALVEQSSDFIGLAGLGGKAEFLNEAGRRLVGLASLEEARRYDVADFFEPGDRSTVLEEALPAARESGFWEGDLSFRNFSTGAAVPVHYTIFPVRDAHGAVTGYGTVTRDLTERRRQESFRDALITFGDRLQGCRRTAEMAAVGAEIMARTLGLDRAGYGTVDEALEHIEIERDWTAPGVASVAGRHRFDDYGEVRAGLEEGREIVIPDVTLDPRTAGNPGPLLDIGVRALINVPVMEHGRIVAVLFLHDRQVRDWRTDKLAFIRDIAERTRAAIERFRAEASRRESEEQFRVFAQAIPNQVWAAHPDGSLYWFNDQFYAYCGAPEGSVLGPDAWARIVHPDDVGPATAAWAQAREAEGIYETEYRVRRVDGAYRWFLVRGEPVRDAAGRVTRWVGTNTDIDDRKRAAAELEHLAATLEQQVEERTRDRDRMWRLSTDVMLVARFEATIVAVNPAWTALFGWSAAELIGRSFMDLVHPDDAAATAAAASDLSDGATIPRFENRYRHKDGSYRWLSWTAVPDEDFIHAVGRDIQAEKEAAQALARTEEALRQSQKMEAVGQLTGGLAHDFNNLLAGISGSLELMQTRMSQGRLTDIDRYMTAAQGASKRAAALTHRLLAFSRRQTLDPKPTDVNALVNGMEDLIRRTVGPSVHIEVVGAAGLWPALVDPHQLENALLNLCINARDAMPEGGRITIETANKWLDEHGARDRDLAPGQYLSLCVTDTGTGMTSDVIARAFDPFFTTKPIGQGTGLGLSMIYGFARQSGGQVRIYSEVGQGTTMCLYLPRHYGEAETDVRLPDLASAPRAEQGETVLVVDDEPTVRMLVTEVLEDLGYTAIEAADAASGLKVLQSDVRMDLLVTDVGLPGGMNGRQMADAARVNRPDLKVLFITGYAENAAVGNGHLEPGMQVLTKPFVMEVLASRIKELIAAA
ncbi:MULTISPECIES: PAS domain S-box protein [Methylobacterium]|uniref:histidine kinase n=1 Tax=Methylobacterium radiotolerans TaxID=31998 RepID=A0ABV2NCH9_9HYPH|nr:MULTISPECIES: PAS domain S-box protein [Methylobacterium]MBP2492576.1 PAS domain S-box-containing protein [Methylobacterium sp. PvP105]MBP2501052.1 PAS domain S-box-containing protein [Methylobacterium sp. PvP109]MCX7333508.1 PAS domain S-box protein [Hyphomicrobiales bacterium]